MALRELTRSIGRYRGMLLMMAFTLSLTGFTASMASTIDRSLVNSINYSMGADLVLVTASDAETDTADDGSLVVVGYNIPPVQDLYSVDGVYAAARVGRLPGPAGHSAPHESTATSWGWIAARWQPLHATVPITRRTR